MQCKLMYSKLQSYFVDVKTGCNCRRLIDVLDTTLFGLNFKKRKHGQLNYFYISNLTTLFVSKQEARLKKSCRCGLNTVTRKIQSDQRVCVHPTITVHTTDDLKMVIREYIRNVDRATLNTVFENKFRRVNKFLETGVGYSEHYL
jgi:hypothetical protein